MSTPSSSAVRALSLEYKSLQEEPVEGFRVKLLNDDNLFEWEVAIFGPPDTLYQGGYFKVSFIFLFISISFSLLFHNNVEKKHPYVCVFAYDLSLSGRGCEYVCVCMRSLHGYSSGNPLFYCAP